MKLNDENIDELMFQLLEGDIQGEERTLLLDAINADKNYSRQWQAWQQTVLNPNEELLVMNTGKLLKKESKNILPWLKYCAAAVLIAAVAIGVYYSAGTVAPKVAKQEKPVNPKLQIIKVPSIEPANNGYSKKNDSVISLRQKVQMMVHQSDPESSPTVKAENLIMSQKNIEPSGLEKTLVKNETETPQLIKNEPDVFNSADVNPVALADNSGVMVTVISGKETEASNSFLMQKFQEKKNLLTRIFSQPKLQIVNDSNTYTRKKFILENKAYKIIAGF